MRLAETVTFSGRGQVERRAELRGDSAAIAELQSCDNHKMLLTWRGKVLVSEHANQISLAGLGQGRQRVWQEYSKEPIFLGQAGDVFWSAIDISAWQPVEEPETLGAFQDTSRQTHPELGPEFSFAEIRGIMAQLCPSDAEIAATAKAILGWHDSHRYCSSCGDKSNMEMAGWQRSCASCATHHFPRTDPVVIMLVTKGNNLLLGRSPGWPDAMYSLLAGFVEPGETIEAAVRREVKEESNIDVGDVRYLASQPWPFPSSLMIGCHGLALTTEITLDPVELEDAFWISRDELADVFAGTSDRIAPARAGSIAQFLMHNWLADQLD